MRARKSSNDSYAALDQWNCTPCRDGTEVVLWQLSGAGHVWPGGIRDYNPEFLGAGTAIIDANAEMWKFFSRFRR